MIFIWKERIYKWIKNLNLTKEEIRKIVLVFVTSVVLAISLVIIDNQPPNTILWRNTYGGGDKNDEFLVSIPGTLEKELISVQLNEQVYTKKQWNELKDLAWELVVKELENEYESLNMVREKLELPTRVGGYPFTLSWSKSPGNIFDASGNVIDENLEGGGTDVVLLCVMEYGSYSQEYSKTIKVLPQENSEKELIIQELNEELSKAQEVSKYKDTLELPKELNGEKIQWTKEWSYRGIMLLVLGVVMAVLLLLKKQQDIQEEQKLKLKQMEKDYPQIINTFVLYMGAGMTSKNTWGKIVEEYQNKGVTREAYTQLQQTYQEMNNGISEVEAYERFAKRCELGNYKKFALLLSQNVKKGTKGLKQILEGEAKEAFEIRKRQAKAEGEAAGTLLLMPMFFMLSVVLVIIVVPAFMSVQL